MKRRFVFFILLLIIFPVQVFSFELADLNDIFTVNYPLPNQTIGGSTNVEFTVYDDDQGEVEYSTKLFDSLTCYTQDLGNIGTVSKALSSNTIAHSFVWNTGQTSTLSEVGDGKYCLEICVSLKNGAGSYSSCNSRIVNIVNNNSLPAITSVPTKLKIKESEPWEYRVTAVDADSDPLTFRLVQSAGFLSIDPISGLITTNTVSKKLPDNITTAEYRIVVAVDDGVSGSTTQQFVLTIEKDVLPGGSNGNGIASSNSPSVISFSYPIKGSVLTKKINEIKFRAEDLDEISEIVLNYSADSKNFKVINKFTTELTKKDFKYNWDISDIADGKYVLQLIVKDRIGVYSSNLSPQFEIKKDSEPDENNVSKPLIINVKPVDGSDVDTKKPEISGEFVASNEESILPDTFSILLNAVNIKEFCEVTEKNFNCSIQENLNEGVQSLEISIADSSGQKASTESVFSVKTKSDEPSEIISNNGDVVNIFGKDISRNTFIAAILLTLLCTLLILIPWILIFIWNEKKKREGAKVTVKTQTSVPQNSDVILDTPNITVNYTQPESLTTQLKNEYGLDELDLSALQSSDIEAIKNIDYSLPQTTEVKPVEVKPVEVTQAEPAEKIDLNNYIVNTESNPQTAVEEKPETPTEIVVSEPENIVETTLQPVENITTPEPLEPETLPTVQNSEQFYNTQNLTVSPEAQTTSSESPTENIPAETVLETQAPVQAEPQEGENLSAPVLPPAQPPVGAITPLAQNSPGLEPIETLPENFTIIEPETLPEESNKPEENK